MSPPIDRKLRRQRAESAGRRAEWIASLWLMAHGWRIISRRRRLPMIEVDLVARRGSVVAIVEVKRRATIELAIAALHLESATRLRRAAASIAAETLAGRSKSVNVRVDLIALAPGKFPRHITNVI